jgi:hypothetical protein
MTRRVWPQLSKGAPCGALVNLVDEMRSACRRPVHAKLCKWFAVTVGTASCRTTSNKQEGYSERSAGPPSLHKKHLDPHLAKDHARGRLFTLGNLWALRPDLLKTPCFANRKEDAVLHLRVSRSFVSAVIANGV